MTGSSRPELTEMTRRLLDSLGEGVSVADTSGSIVYSNRAADRILGLAATDRPPAEWADYYGIFLPDGRTRYPADQYPLVRALRGESTNDVQMVVRNKAHPWAIRIAVTGRAIRDPDGEITGATVIFRDVTDLVGAQASLARANDELRRIQALKDDLYAFVMHDLNGPLTGVLALSELLSAEERLTEDARASVAELHNLADSIHRMVGDLLDLKVSDDGALEPHFSNLVVHELFQELHQMISPRAVVAGRKVVVSDQVLGLNVYADPDLLLRTLQNLVDNGLKYAPHGGTIRVEAREGSPGTVRFLVCDDGPGVPEELRDAIFEKYARIERSEPVAARRSRGMGLRFCRVATEAQRGRIWVEDGEPSGARFCLELPVPREA